MSFLTAGTNRKGSRGGQGNIRQRRKSIPLTAANIKSYPGNFRLNDASVDFTDITTSAFYVSKQTLWAKE
jgi:hypothetical protein